MPETWTLQRTQQTQTQDRAENISVLTGDNSNSPSQGPQIQTQTQDRAENISVLTGDNSNSPSQRPQAMSNGWAVTKETSWPGIQVVGVPVPRHLSVPDARVTCHFYLLPAAPDWQGKQHNMTRYVLNKEGRNGVLCLEINLSLLAQHKALST